MRLRRMCSPSRFLYLSVLTFFIILIVMFVETMLVCNDDELVATRNLLQKYSSQVQDLKDSNVLLRQKLKKIESHMASMSNQRNSSFVPDLPIIYIITPTHSRLEQKADLSRMSHTLLHIKNIHWIIIEDSEARTELVSKFLKTCGLSYTHLFIQTPPAIKLSAKDPNWLKPRGVLQRNAGIEWLHSNASPSKHSGVVYFADDDNTYSLRLFDEMRYTKKASVWPVGLVGNLRFEKPIVQNRKVIGWFTYWKPSRAFAMDMAGFAVNLQLFFEHPKAAFSNAVPRGYQESTLLSGLEVTLDDLEPKANLCTEILVWHTRTEKSSTKNEDKLIKKLGHGSDITMEV